MVSEEVILGKFWAFLRDLLREMEWGGGTYRGEGGRKLFFAGGLPREILPRPPPPLFDPPLWRCLEGEGLKDDKRGRREGPCGQCSELFYPLLPCCLVRAILLRKDHQQSRWRCTCWRILSWTMKLGAREFVFPNLTQNNNMFLCLGGFLSIKIQAESEALPDI